MKKSTLSLAVAASLFAAGTVNAAPTAYGFIDVSINSVSLDATGATDPELDMSSNTSAFGLKGSEDLGDGMKAIYKIEFQVDVTTRVSGGSLTDRDQFVGLKGGMGKVIIGTASSNYKQMGGKIDPFYRTAIQARSVGQQSGLHKGAGLDGGRMDHMVQYTSPKMGGIQAVANIGISGSADEANGLGIRYSNKMVTAWFDLLNRSGAAGLSATKVGAKIKATKALTIGVQFEKVDTSPTTDQSVNFLSAAFAVNKNNTVAFTYGKTEDVKSGFNLGLWHKMSKKTSVYVAMNSTSDEQPGAAGTGVNDDGSTTIVAGIRKKF